jgi:hypothetical protein
VIELLDAGHIDQNVDACTAAARSRAKAELLLEAARLRVRGERGVEGCAL